MIPSLPGPSLTAQDTALLARLEQLSRGGAAGLAPLIESLGEVRWPVRRGVVAALARMGEVAVRPLCEVLTGGRDNETRLAAAVDALVLCKGDVEAALVEVSEEVASKAEAAAVLCDVAQILGRRRSGPSVPLLTRLTEHADDNVAIAAIEALGKIGGGMALAALAGAAQSGNFFRTFAAIDYLGRCRHPDAVPPLLGLIAQPLYALEAIRALGRTGDERAIRPLIGLLLRPVDATLRAVGLALSDIHSEQLSRLGMGHVVSDALRGTALPLTLGRRLAALVRAADPQEQKALCRVLGWMGGEEAVEVLLGLLQGGDEVARAAAEALGEVGRTADEKMLSALRGGDASVRLAVLPYLGRRSVAVADVVACLEDPDAAVRAAACEALGQLGEPSAVDALFERLADSSAQVAQAALGAIQSLGSPRTEALTLKAVRATDVKIRRAALRLIAYFGYPSGLDALLGAMAEPDAKLRDAAIYGLPFIEDERAGAALLAAAVHPSPTTRAAAMRALSHAKPGDAVLDRLRQGLSDEDAWVRYFAVQSLGKLGDVDSEETLVRLMEDPAGQVRVAVVDALALLDSETATARLQSFALSDDPDVQRAALLGLGMTQRRSSLPVLRQALHAAPPATRLVALSALAAFEGPDILSELLQAARDVDPSVRNAAVGFLAERGGTAATQELVGLLGNQPLRELVLQSLALPVDGRVPGLLAALMHAEEELAPLLVGALVRMQRPDATAALYQALLGAGTGGRKAAAQAIAALGTAAARTALERAAREDVDEDVRRICALALVP